MSLKPCPLCRCQAKISFDQYCGLPWKIECEACGVKITEVSQESVTTKWNLRRKSAEDVAQSMTEQAGFHGAVSSFSWVCLQDGQKAASFIIPKGAPHRYLGAMLEQINAALAQAQDSEIQRS